MPRTPRTAKDYLKDMIAQFDPSGERNVGHAKQYLIELANMSTKTASALGETEYGAWTVAKHIFLFEYLKPFFEIGSRRFRRLVYVDLFGGPGINSIPFEGRSLFVPGSPLISYLYTYETKDGKRAERFDAYHFFEKSPARATILQSRLNRLKQDFNLPEAPTVHPKESQLDIMNFLAGEADLLNQPKKTPERSDQGILFLLFIDPEGLSIEFKTLSQLLKRYAATVAGEDSGSSHLFTADVVYTAPTHWAKHSGNPLNMEKYCGVPTEMYSADDDAIARAMKDRIQVEVGGRCFVHSIPVRNSKNALLYHILIVTKSEGASKAADHIARALRLRPVSLESALSTILANATTMDDFQSAAS